MLKELKFNNCIKIDSIITPDVLISIIQVNEIFLFIILINK